MLFYIKKTSSNDNIKHSYNENIADTIEIQNIIKKEIIIENKRKSLSPLDETIHAVFEKDKDIKDLLKEITDSTEITFVIPKNFDSIRTDIGMDIYSIKIKDILDIFLSNERYIWFSKDTNSIIILEK
ncbi:MAG: hypothetical protein M0Q02_01235 [Candidatus Muirbacterium halophilum]|nr:hypothetical protein [Candidatus Muirbacterium halophilum]